MLTQSPWTQGLLEHSSTSAREGKATCEGPWGTAKPSNGKTSPEELWELWEQPLLTNALPSDVLLVAHVALAAVAGRGGDAAPVQAQVGEVLADVDGLVQRGRSWGAQGGLGSPWMAQELSEGTSEGSKVGGKPRKAPFLVGNQGDIPDRSQPRWICLRAQLLPSAGATSQHSPEPRHSLSTAPLLPCVRLGAAFQPSGSPLLPGPGQTRELPMLELPGPIPGSPGIPPCPFAPFGPMPPGPLSPGPTPLGPNPGIPGKFPGKPGTTGSPSMQSLRYSSETKQGCSSSAWIPLQGTEGWAGSTGRSWREWGRGKFPHGNGGFGKGVPIPGGV